MCYSQILARLVAMNMRFIRVWVCSLGLVLLSGLPAAAQAFAPPSSSWYEPHLTSGDRDNGRLRAAVYFTQWRYSVPPVSVGRSQTPFLTLDADPSLLASIDYLVTDR